MAIGKWNKHQVTSTKCTRCTGYGKIVEYSLIDSTGGSNSNGQTFGGNNYKYDKVTYSNGGVLVSRGSQPANGTTVAKAWSYHTIGSFPNQSYEFDTYSDGGRCKANYKYTEYTDFRWISTGTASDGSTKYSANWSSANTFETIGNTTCTTCGGEGYHYSKGTYIADVTSPPGAYPANGKHSDGYWYVYIGLVAPNPPITLTVPDTITGGKISNISWSQATSDGGAISGYELHRSLNKGTFVRVYRGSALTYADTVPYGSNTVQYSIRTYDVDNQFSDFKVGVIKNVINNNPPTITGTNSDKGSINVGFDYVYSVTDEDAADTITVTEAIDGVVIRSFAVTRDVEYIANVTNLTWLCLLNGAHTLTITAVDNRGGTAVRTITFTKTVTVIEFELAETLACDAAATKAIMRMMAALPATALVTIMATNNANDVDPVWVDVTTKVLDGGKIFFANVDKTATDWGYGIKVRIDRNNAEGDCYITSIGGNFE